MRQAHFGSVCLAVILVAAGCGEQSNQVDAQQTADAGLEQAREEAAQRQRRIIYNDDGGNARSDDDTPEKFLASRQQQVVDTQVDLVTYDPFYMDNVPSYPSRTVEPPTTPAAMVAAGHDPLALAVEFSHAHDTEFFASFRMNDIHESIPGPGLGDDMAIWKREHPEYLLGTEADWDKYPHSSPRKWWVAKDYAVPEVRERQFLVIQEVCEDYNVDGVELDWFRSPMFFRPTLDLQPVEPKHIDIMNDFVRRVRAMTERVGRQRGRPLLVAVRVPMSVERSLAVGLDLVTWLRDDLCDIVAVGGGYAPMAMAPQVREMAEFVHQYDRPLYACISGSGMREEHSSVEAWRGAAMNIWHAGADAVYTFNFFPAQRDERLSQLGSPETLKGLDKIYGIDYIVVDTFEGDLRPGLVVPDRLPLPLSVDGTVTARLPVGEDIAANAPEGKTTHATLRLRISSLAQGDEVTVKLNGQQLGSAVPAEALGNEPATAWVELELNPEVVQEGDNLVEVALTTQRAIEEPVVLDRLDLIVRYQ